MQDNDNNPYAAFNMGRPRADSEDRDLGNPFALDQADDYIDRGIMEAAAAAQDARERGDRWEALDHSATAWARRIKAPVRRAAKMTAHGMTLGGSDEIHGAVNVAFGDRSVSAGQRFRDAQNLEQSRIDQIRKKDPLGSGTVELLGGLASGGPAFRAAGAIPGIKQAASAPGVAGYLGRTAQAGTVGAGAGALYDNENRLRGAAYGGAFGAGFNAALEPVARAVTSHLIRTRPTAFERKQGVTPAEVQADDMVVKRMSNDQVRNTAGRANMSELEGRPWDADSVRDYRASLQQDGGGIQETLMDLPGAENVAGLASAAGNVPGPAKAQIRQTLTTRMRGSRPDEARTDALQGTPQRIVERVYRTLTGSRTIPSGADYSRAAQQALDDVSREVAPLYAQATQTPFPQEAFRVGFMDLFTDPASSAFWKGRASHALRGMAGKSPGGNDLGGSTQRALAALSRGEMPAAEDLTVDVLHRLRRSINDDIGRAVRAGENGLASDLTAMRNDFMDAWISDTPAGPAYNEARRLFASSRALDDARTQGERVFDMPEGEFWQFVDRASEPERAAFMMGAARKVTQLSERAENGRPAINRVLNRTNRARLREIWPKDARGGDGPFNRFVNRVTRERSMLETSNRIQTGSRTTPLKEEIMDATFGESNVSSLTDEFIGAIEGGGGLQGFARRRAGGAARRMTQPGIYNRATNQAVGDLLTTPLGPEVERRLARQIERQLRARYGGQEAGRLAQQVGERATAPVGVLGAQVGVNN